MRNLKEKLFLKEYDEEKIKIANKTARASGASALNKDGSIRSVVGRYILDNEGIAYNNFYKVLKTFSWLQTTTVEGETYLELIK